MNEFIYYRNNFLTDDECDFLISYYEKKESLTAFYECNKTNTLILHSKTVDNIGKELRPFYDRIDNLVEKLEGPNLYVNVSEIVKWSPNSSQMDFHFDRKDDLLGLVIYLNDDFIGRKTYFENGIMVNPKKGSILLFTGNSIKLGVMQNFNGNRFTLTCWIRSLNN